MYYKNLFFPLVEGCRGTEMICSFMFFLGFCYNQSTYLKTS